jgi:putative membrane protein insertion efficiency factor
MKNILIFIVKLYQWALSPFLPRACRFHPTCSEYAILSIKKFGLFKGMFFSTKRILRCNPFSPGGRDPVP